MAGARRNVRSRFSVAKTNDINTPSVARGIGKYEAYFTPSGARAKAAKGSNTNTVDIFL